MTLRLVHTGGVPELVPDGEAFVDTSVAVPRNPATGQFVLTRKTLRRQCLDIAKPFCARPQNGLYGPVSLLERHLDQCAWLGDDGLCCGQRVADQSYCPDHYEQSRR